MFGCRPGRTNPNPKNTKSKASPSSALVINLTNLYGTLVRSNCLFPPSVAEMSTTISMLLWRKLNYLVKYLLNSRISLTESGSW
jgi:hypothetical protein